MAQPGRIIPSRAGITMLNSLTWVTQEVRLDYHCPKFCSQKPVPVPIWLQSQVNMKKEKKQACGQGILFLCAAVEGLSLLSVRRQQTFLKTRKPLADVREGFLGSSVAHMEPSQHGLVCMQAVPAADLGFPDPELG